MYGLGVISTILAQFGLQASPLDAALEALGTGKSTERHAARQPSVTKSQFVHTTVNGNDRRYLVNIPWNYTKSNPTPLILSFHGNGKSALEQEGLTGLSNLATPGWIIVYPQGLGDSWQGPNYADPSAHDLVFVDIILAEMRRKYSIKNNQIYATGKSNGGGFVGTIACNTKQSSQFAAFAPVSGAYYTDNGGDLNCTECTPPTDQPCQIPSPAIPILEFHGSKDGVIPYNGGARFGSDGSYSGTVPPIPEYLTTWATRYNCSLAPKNHTAPAFNGTVNTTDYGCGDLVRGIEIGGMGHCWPWTVDNSEQPKCSKTPINATNIIVQFFSNHSRS